MGNVQPSSSRLYPVQPELHLTVSRDLHRRVAEAAKRIEQPMTGWIRMAIIEKLERDESR